MYDRPRTSSSVDRDSAAPRAKSSALSRPKAQLACDPCRRKKIRCDRQRPCGKCAALCPEECTYPLVPSNLLPTRPKKDGVKLNARIDRLERLMTSISAAGSKGLVVSPDDTHGTSASASDVSDTHARMRADGEGMRFLKASHWETVLDEISDLKDDLARSPHSSEKVQAHGGSLILLGPCSDVSISELICALPCRQAVEALTDILVDDADVPSLLTTIHIPSFRRECEAFWHNPSAVSLPWLALLYAVICLGLQSALRLGLQVPQVVLPDSAVRMYATRVAQCLIKSDYTKPNTHTIQAMILYLACEHSKSIDNSFGARLVFTTIIQQAYRLGFHREPGQFKDMDFLESEMRRRIWAFIVQMDLLLSEKNGLPRVIDARQTDTAEPMNLHDEDLEAGTFPPPSARPNTEPTRVSYMKYKMKLIKMQGSCLDRVNSPQGLSYPDVLELDRSLSEIADARPVWLAAFDNFGDSTAQHSWVYQGIEVDLMINRARMVLHRSYLVPARSQPSYSYSRNACLEAARKVLHHQATLRGHGSVTWRFVSLASHDFLLAAMIVCLDLDQDLKLKTPAAPGSEMSQHIDLLHQSYQAWTRFQNWGDAAEKGATIVGAMLDRVRQLDSPAAPSISSDNVDAVVPQNGGEASNYNYPATFDVTNPADISSVQAGTSGLTYVPDPAQFDVSMFNTALYDAQTDFDWMAWDAQYPGTVFDF